MVPFDLSKPPKVFKTVIKLVDVYVWHVLTWNMIGLMSNGTKFYLNQQDFVSNDINAKSIQKIILSTIYKSVVSKIVGRFDNEVFDIM
jgi:hypothetical protein